MDKTMRRNDSVEIDVPKDYKPEVEKITSMIRKYNGKDLYNGTDLVRVLRIDVLCSLAAMGYGAVAERNSAISEYKPALTTDGAKPLLVITPNKVTLRVSEELMTYLRKYDEADLGK